MYFILLLYSMLNKVSTGFQNVPQNGRIEHTIITHPAGGSFSFCSHFVLNREQNWNKPWTSKVLQNCHTVAHRPQTKCCKIVTLLSMGHTVARLSHCCGSATVDNCGDNVATMWTQDFRFATIGIILECVCACTYNVYCVYLHGISFCYIWYHVFIYRVDITKMYSRRLNYTFLLYASKTAVERHTAQSTFSGMYLPGTCDMGIHWPS